jgi:hypothetical protein
MTKAKTMEPVSTPVYSATANADIKPLSAESVIVESVGHTRKHVIVNLPDDFQLSWLNESPEKIWKQIQTSPDRRKVLAEWDAVELRHHREGYVVYASVSFANSELVRLFDLRKTSKPCVTSARTVTPFTRYAGFRAGTLYSASRTTCEWAAQATRRPSRHALQSTASTRR